MANGTAPRDYYTEREIIHAARERVRDAGLGAADPHDMQLVVLGGMADALRDLQSTRHDAPVSLGRVLREGGPWAAVSLLALYALADRLGLTALIGG